MDFIDDSDDDDTPTEIECIKTDKSQILSNRPQSCGVMQFHNGIEEAMLLHVQRTVVNSSAVDVIKAVDEYCYSRHWMMHIGDEKGAVLDNVLDSVKATSTNPLCVVEIGSYCGYSAVRMASRFSNMLSKVYCIERESKCVEWTQRLASLAGLSDNVEVIEGEVPAAIERLKLILTAPINLLLIDHDKVRYLNDLILFEESGLLLVPGGVVVADNVLSFGCPLDDYLTHVRSTGSTSSAKPKTVCYESSVLHRCPVEYSCHDSASLPSGHYLEDGVEVSVIGGRAVIS
jgi:catechol O-methyltransferase